MAECGLYIYITYTNTTTYYALNATTLYSSGFTCKTCSLDIIPRSSAFFAVRTSLTVVYLCERTYIYIKEISWPLAIGHCSV